jgi:hypothetical protein
MLFLWTYHYDILSNTYFFILMNSSKLVLHLIFSELENKGKIKRAITDDSKTFITLTDEGKKKCIESLDLLQILRVLFRSIVGSEILVRRENLDERGENESVK